MSIDQSIKSIESFQGQSLTASLAEIEDMIIGADAKSSRTLCNKRNINHQFMDSALTIKKMAGQINVIIHAAGILHSLPTLLDEGEIVESEWGLKMLTVN